MIRAIFGVIVFVAMSALFVKIMIVGAYTQIVAGG